MDARFSVIDVFGILARRPRPFIEVLEIMAGRRPQVPGESPWGFPIFRPTTGPSTGPASAGTRFIPGGSSRVERIGVVFGPPKP